MGKIRLRASRADIFGRLQRLAGSEAEKTIEKVIEHLEQHAAQRAIDTLKAFDAQIGGYCGIPAVFCKPPGAYRPLGYVPHFLQHPHPREMARFVIDAVGQHVENLLQRIAVFGFLNRMSRQMFPMGRLVKTMQPFLPGQLYEDLQWLASEVYNHAKHSLDVSDRRSAEDKAHYFELDEALAVCLIGRILAVQLELWSDKSREQLMAER